MSGELDLVDIWRDHNPNIQQFTWRRKHPLKQARLDFFFISQNLYPFVTDTNIISGYRTDHSLIRLKFNLTNQQKCNTYWKFNNSLLGDKEYVRIVKVIFNVVQQYAAKGYEPVDSDNISQTDIKFSINDQLFMEVLLMKIRGKTISYASFKKKETNKLEDNLNTEINKLENRIDNIDFDLLD